MGETKRIVVESFPVDQLPEALRKGLESGRMVRVTVEDEFGEREPRRKLSDFLASAPGRYADPADIVREVRELRGEWDDR